MLKRLAIALTCLSLATLTACGDDSKEGDTATDPAASGAKTVECEYAADGSEPAKEGTEPPASEAPAEGTTAITITTSAGEIKATLDAGKTPCTVNNFLSLTEQGWFDDTTCHRLTTQGIFVLQCGDPSATGMGGPGYTFADELSGEETYVPGTLAMANAGPDTNGSQFFLVYEDSSSLPPGYNVFGQIDDAGIAVLSKIAAKGTDSGAPDGAPKQAVTIEGVSVD